MPGIYWSAAACHKTASVETLGGGLSCAHRTITVQLPGPINIHQHSACLLEG